MMRIFSLEGPLYQFMNRFWDLIKLNFIWLIFSLPIVTIGAATLAAYTVTMKMIDDEEEGIFKTFFKAFKSNWKQGTQMGFIHLAVVYFLYLNLEFLDKLEKAPVFFLIAAMVIGFLGLLYLTYAFPLCARYQNTLHKTLKNSAAIAMKYFVQTLILWMVVGLLIFFFLFNTTLLYFGLLFGPTAIIFTISGVSRKLFEMIEKDNGIA